MPLRRLLTIAALLTTTSFLAAADRPSFRVVGYLPDYRAAKFDPAAALTLTDLILFSAEPSAEGGLDLTRLKDMPWAKLRAFKTRKRIRLIVCVGGWERSAKFATVAGAAEKRKEFVRSAVRTCLDERLDGIDLDWEHPKNAAEQAGYGKLLAELRTAFDPLGLQLSVTLAAWQRLPREAFAAVDCVNVMAYDHEGRHSTFDAAVADLKAVWESGASFKKIVLGLPFYGRGTKDRNRTISYRDIIAKDHPKPDVDEIDGIYFNGPATIRRKTNFALEADLAGVMVWELGQDAPGDESLLKVIRDAIEKRSK